MGKVSFDFTGEVVVVTGAATGIGRCVATSFAKAGAAVAVCDFNVEKASETVKMCQEEGGNAKFYKLDVTGPAEEIIAVRDQIIRDFGQIDVLMSNAGVGPKAAGSFYNIDDEGWYNLFNVNVFGTVKVCRIFSEVLKNQGHGRVIMTASASAYSPSALMPHYSASKISVINIMEALAKELGDYNVNVNVLNPGFVYTPLYSEGGGELLLKSFKPFQNAGIKEPKTGVELLAKSSALHRMQEPIDMANMVMYLASDGGREITGQVLNVDSGFNIRI